MDEIWRINDISQTQQLDNGRQVHFSLEVIINKKRAHSIISFVCPCAICIGVTLCVSGHVFLSTQTYFMPN